MESAKADFVLLWLRKVRQKVARLRVCKEFKRFVYYLLRAALKLCANFLQSFTAGAAKEK